VRLILQALRPLSAYLPQLSSSCPLAVQLLVFALLELLRQLARLPSSSARL
jgi:hypothetical protein